MWVCNFLCLFNSSRQITEVNQTFLFYDWNVIGKILKNYKWSVHLWTHETLIVTSKNNMQNNEPHRDEFKSKLNDTLIR